MKDTLLEKMAGRIKMPDKSLAPAGRDAALLGEDIQHYVLSKPILAPYPEGCQSIVFAMGCFWGAEKRFWSLKGVYNTAVGYVGGYTRNPSYEEVCSGSTGHTEGVLVIYDPRVISLDALLKVFWESHDPTQGMRQGNDLGTQYRSGIYFESQDQKSRVEHSHQVFQEALNTAGYGKITSEITPLETFYYAEAYHQQYLAKNPNGYCGLGGTGVLCSAKSECDSF